MTKTFRFVVAFGQYVDVSASSKRGAIQTFKADYAHLLKNGRLHKTAIWSVS